METTLFPLATLPACASKCGPLYDANGACVPPAVATAAASVYDSCFCKDARLTAFSTGTAGVCDSVCTAAGDLGSIQAWYTGFCANIGEASPTTATTGTPSSTNSSSYSDPANRSWLSTHYQWVIFLVVVVVAIAGIWTGACIWRRRYLRRKDRQYALGKGLSHQTESGRVVPNAGSNAASVHLPSAGIFQPAPLSSAGVYDAEKPKKSKKKWIVRERT
jgi:hypothetical protein